MMRVLVVSACLLVPAMSFGQASRQPTKEFVFPDEEVGGKKDVPPGEVVIADPPPPPHSSLVRVRQNFSEKVLRSVSEL